LLQPETITSCLSAVHPGKSLALSSLKPVLVFDDSSQMPPKPSLSKAKHIQLPPLITLFNLCISWGWCKGLEVKKKNTSAVIVLFILQS